MRVKELKAPEAAEGGTLADRLAEGPLPLGQALRCATDVALALRGLHQDGRAHGRVEASTVLLRGQGARLGPPLRSTCVPTRGDVAAFGWILHQMLTGDKPNGKCTTIARRPPARKGVTGLYASAMRLAERCYASSADRAPAMPKVLTEIRLLAVMARQVEEEGETPGVNRDAEEPGFPESAASEYGECGECKPQRPEPHPLPALVTGETCPRCGGDPIRKSKPRTTWEQILTVFGVTIRRCHRCYYRYIMILEAPIDKEIASAVHQ